MKAETEENVIVGPLDGQSPQLHEEIWRSLRMKLLMARVAAINLDWANMLISSGINCFRYEIKVYGGDRDEFPIANV